MGLAYLFALIVGAGILTFQALMGGHGDHAADHGGDHGGDHAHDHGKEVKDQGLADGGFVALFLSTRFWIFAALGFGLSGTLLTYLFGGSFLPTLLTAVGLGLASGLGASAAFRALRRVQSSSGAASSAVGRLARVLVPVEVGKTGQVRIELDGHTVDLMARTEHGRAERGDMVLIEEIEGELATVSAAPEELK